MRLRGARGIELDPMANTTIPSPRGPRRVSTMDSAYGLTVFWKNLGHFSDVDIR
jgi:hypothetical protein